MSAQLDRTLDQVSASMRRLKRSLRGVPINRGRFRQQHDETAKAVARLVVAMEDSRIAMK